MTMGYVGGTHLSVVQKKIRVDSGLYGNVILIVILASNIWSSHGQNVNSPQDDAADYVGSGGGGGGGSSVVGNGAADGDRVVSSGEVMASRLPVLNEHEPSCEELKAMWRYAIISYSSTIIVCYSVFPFRILYVSHICICIYIRVFHPFPIYLICSSVILPPRYRSIHFGFMLQCLFYVIHNQPSAKSHLDELRNAEN